MLSLSPRSCCEPGTILQPTGDKLNTITRAARPLENSYQVGRSVTVTQHAWAVMLRWYFLSESGHIVLLCLIIYWLDFFLGRTGHSFKTGLLRMQNMIMKRQVTHIYYTKIGLKQLIFFIIQALTSTTRISHYN